MPLNPKFVNQRVEVLLHELSVFGAAETDLLRQIVEKLGGIPTVGGQPLPETPVNDLTAYQQEEIKEYKGTDRVI